MNFLEIIHNRQSVRAFLKKPVAQETLIQLLEVARFAPSGVNTQPWRVAVLGQKARQAIAQDYIAAKEAQEPDCPDYQYYPKEWIEPYLQRRRACGLALYSALHIAKEDAVRRKEQWYKNYSFFGAPAGLMILIDSRLETGSWLDTGMFIQTILLAARGLGLEACPQAALSERPDIIRKHLNLSTELKVVCGIALGYADWSDPINQYRTEREPIEVFTTWHE
jgi:nitroreductase